MRLPPPVVAQGQSVALWPRRSWFESTRRDQLLSARAGRGPVSKTAAHRFDSCRRCQFFWTFTQDGPPCGRPDGGSALKRLVQLLQLLQQPLAGKDHVVIAVLLVARHFRLLRSPVTDRRLPEAMANEV